MITRSGFNEKEQTSLCQVHSRFGRSEEKTRSWKHEVSDVRIVLLGKSVLENNRVGNSILGCVVFDTVEHPARMLRQKSQRVSGRVKDRHVTLINSPNLLQPHLSLHQITQIIRECVSLSAPGPHVFIIVLQYNDFTEEDRYKLYSVLREFNEEAMKHTIIITTDQETYRAMVSSYVVINTVQQLINECGGGNLQLEETKPEWSSEVFNRVDEILNQNQEQYLTCKQFHFKGTPEENKEGNPEETLKNKSVSKHLEEKLKLVLCGYDATLNISVFNILQRIKIDSSHPREFSSDCVKREEEISGRQLSVVELPALSRLSEEEVMRQTLLSVTLCHPGVHAFIIVVPDRPLNNDEKSEIQKILKIFDSREHFMVLFTTDEARDDTRLTELIKHSPESQSLISRCGGQYRLMGLNEPESSTQIPDLLDYIENMKTEPYSPQMYVKAQENRVRRETEEKCKEELKGIKDDSEEKLRGMKQKYEDEARKQAEEFYESTERKLKHVLELTEMVKEKKETH